MIDTTVAQLNAKDVEWPGWPLKENRFGDEFDLEARRRMITGSNKLIPFLLHYKEWLDKPLLEIGPFFNPLLQYADIRKHIPQEKQVTFLENDPHAVRWLADTFDCQIIDLDMNTGSFTEQLYGQYRDMTREGFDVIVISQVLNYVDPKRLLDILFPLLNSNACIFINNVTDYGIPELFCPARAGSNAEIERIAVAAGYVVREKHIFPIVHEKEPEGRMILVLAKP